MSQPDPNVAVSPRQWDVEQARGMTMLTGVSIVLPCHDEEANVGAAVAQATHAAALCAHAYEVIVVDDGSRDGTRAVASRLAAGDPHVRVVVHDRNRGYGAALRSGIEAAREPWVLLTDADLQFDFMDLAAFAELADDHDLIAGYREQRNDPWRRRLAGAAWTWLVDVLLGLRVRDVDCAFKLVRRDLLAQLALTADGAAISAELLAGAAARGARVGELAVRHFPRGAGRQSGLRPAVVVRASAELLRLRRALA